MKSPGKQRPGKQRASKQRVSNERVSNERVSNERASNERASNGRASNTLLRLEIATTWDGKTIAEAERVQIGLGMENGALILEVDAPAHGDPPPPGAPGPRAGLWEHEVVELFVAGPSSGEETTPYTEIELSPHGHYLVLQLLGRRRVIRSKLLLTYVANVASDAGRWYGRARLDASLLPPPPHRLNAYAIHGQGLARRFLAWAPVFGASPDFHRLDAFVPVEIPLVEALPFA